MRDGCRLILVEGQPFSGKSTLSEFLAEQMVLNGIDTEWVCEGEMLRRYFPRVLAELDGESLIRPAELLKEWEGFVATVAESDRPMMVDSPVSYTGVYPLISLDLPADEIHRELGVIREMCLPLRPRVIHLLADPAVTVPASIEERGSKWKEQVLRQSDENPYQQARGRSGLAAAIEFQGECQAMTASVLQSWDTLSLDVSRRDWPAHRAAALSFLGLSYQEPPRVVVPVEGFVGTYESEAGRRFVVVLEGGGLTLREGDGRLGAMIPVSERRFHLRASDVDLEFEGDTMTLIKRIGTVSVYRRCSETNPN